MKEKMKMVFFPKLGALFFIGLHLFGVETALSLIIWKFNWSSTNFFYPVLDILTSALTIGAVIYLRRIRPELFSLKSLRKLDFFLIFLCFGALYIYFGKLLFVGGNPNIDLVFFRKTPQAILVALQPFIIGPILEELLYRGVLMTSFFEKSKYFLDCLLSAIFFSIAHLFSYGFYLDLFKNYTVMGLVLALLFKKTRSIYPPVLVHIFWNIYLGWDTILFVFLGK
ncbi:lysostaphin resistance A-like protein [Streptococcus sp. H49]|uniref:CPBP family intramembrane glutamic endopeptidase n=1 Tax=Streptococcus huangxiaojuni TaxID=3237239 RepID=UPI0034A1F336